MCVIHCLQLHVLIFLPDSATSTWLCWAVLEEIIITSGCEEITGPESWMCIEHCNIRQTGNHNDFTRTME